MHQSPYTFHPVLREAEWGGSSHRKVFGRPCAARARVGESLDLCGASVVDRGPRKGASLAQLVSEDREGILGKAVCDRAPGRFPLALRWVDARDRTPLEVFASERPGDSRGSARTAAWYVLRTDPKGSIRRGILPGTERAEFGAAVARGEGDAFLYRFDAKAGDVVFLPPGVLHSAGPGVLLLEVAYDSGTVHRLTGAGSRRTSPNFANALEVIDFRTLGVARCKPIRVRSAPLRCDRLVQCEAFALELLHLRKRLEEDFSGQRFAALTCCAGRAVLRSGQSGEEVPLSTGRTALIPARLGKLEIVPDPDCTLVRTTIE